MHQSSPQRQSAVLILALLLMGAIVGSAIALSTVISDSNHQTSTLNNFIEASLAADNGLERSLAVIKIGRLNQTLTATKTAIGTGQLLASPTTTIAVRQAGTNTDSIVIPKLRPGETYSFDIIPAPQTPPILDDLTFGATCTTVNACTYSNIAVSWIGLNSSLSTIFTGQANPTLSFTYDGVHFPAYISSEMHLTDNVYNENNAPVTFNGAPAYGYRIRITAVAPSAPAAISADDLAIKNITIGTCTKSNSGPCTPVATALDSRIAIDSTGTSQSSLSKKTVSVPWQPGASGIFNYVIFSEGPIDKTNN